MVGQIGIIMEETG
ncbi:hypothetical protein M8C21_032463 [Ambrosia artemisiifolia]|uniref:Uncharacterized protein n=1 Tax=Ambrosia artemisiifolia TaxID=4212 RepID=A0AAD5DE88_AMBAR|nr:hypothetical protein M8C21_032463 [Ambrosia artemisiifolia]